MSNKIFRSVFLVVVLLSMALANTSVFAETGLTSLVESDVEVIDTNSNEPIVPFELVKNVYEKNNIELKESDIPTIKEFNEKINKELNVSKDNPIQTIDLGNGFTVEARVWEENSLFKTNSTIQNTTAKGSFTVRSLGVDQFRITCSVNFSYDGKKIVNYQNPPSASAEAWLGWTGEITNKTVQEIDSTAADAIADANYKYIKLVGNVAGHIELRFTATGNYYMHDTYIGTSRY